MLLSHLNTAAARYHHALDLLPDQAIAERAVAHHQLGVIYDDAGLTDTALHHYQQSIRYEEDAGNRYGAGQSRQAIAVTLADAGRLNEALLYAQAALRDYEPYGPSATANIDKTHRLIATLEQHLAATDPNLKVSS